MTIGSAVGTINGLVSGADEICVHLFAKGSSFDTTSFNNRLVTTFIDGTNGGIILSVHDGTNAKLKVGARVGAAEGFQSAHSTTVLSTGVQYPLGGRIDIGGDTIYVYVNGALETTQGVTFANATYTPGTVTAGALDSLGSAVLSSVPVSTATQFAGDISELAIWTFTSGDTPMADQDFLDLANGKDPRRIAKGTLKYYLKVLGAASPEVPLVGSGNGVITGSLPQATHPTVWGPPALFNRRRQAA